MLSRPPLPTTAIACAIAVAAFVVSPCARADVPNGGARREMRLRVLTFNVFGIANLSPAIDERMAAIGPAILALRPDLVLIQELWRKQDAELLSQSLAREGFVSVRSFGADHWTDPGRSGLFVASTMAVVAERFEPFEAGLVPHIPWHVDWWGGKGFFGVKVATPLGEIGVVDVHAQASYATGHYEAIRIAQGLQIAASLARPDSVAPPGTPLILGGDVNAPPGEPSTDLLEALTGAHVEDRTLSNDVVMTRSGADLALTVVSTERVLLEPLRLADGTFTPLSDHEGILVDLLLEACGGPCPAAPSAASAEQATDAAERIVSVALSEIDDDASRTRWLRAATLIGAFGSAWVAVRAARSLSSRKRRRDRVLVPVFVLWCLFWSSWWTYTAFVFAPHQLETLDGARGSLEGGAAGWWRRHAPVTVTRPSSR